MKSPLFIVKSSLFRHVFRCSLRFVAPFSAEDRPVALPGRPHLGRPLSTPDGGQWTRSDGRTLGKRRDLFYPEMVTGFGDLFDGDLLVKVTIIGNHYRSPLGHH